MMTHPQLTDATNLLRHTLWPRLEATEADVFARVLEGFTRHRVGEEHFASVTGYGHDDMGREVTDRVFAHALEAEAALVRVSFASGTHAISVALNGCVRPGSSLVSVTGNPYDTLEEVIGIRGDDWRSLTAQGVHYDAVSVFDEANTFNADRLLNEPAVQTADVLYIQRSRGYSLRPAIVAEQMQTLIATLRQLNPTAIVLVDNCYGEFTEPHEPTFYGADLLAGSLIKNPGGGIVPSGGYVAGRADLVERCASALTCPGVGPHGGYTFNQTRLVLQGLFLAPGVVCEALKGMTLAAKVFEEAGYSVTPAWDAPRSDIIQVIHLGEAEKLVAFCGALQRVSPIGSYVTPVPDALPGYEDAVVMAGGTFIEGSTLELSADGPLRPPYTVFLQGGLRVTHTQIALAHMLAAL
jgi:cystathionine beta-lyase family protein involved in aluminum resistance